MGNGVKRGRLSHSDSNNTAKTVQLFDLGQVVATPGAIDLLDELNINMFSLLDRHKFGDWGDLCEEDKKENDFSVKNGFRILSSYNIGKNGEKVWIITENDRSVTTFLLPSEY